MGFLTVVPLLTFDRGNAKITALMRNELKRTKLNDRYEAKKRHMHIKTSTGYSFVPVLLLKHLTAISLNTAAA